MKWGLWALAGTALGAAALSAPQAPQPLLVYGHFDGHLAPCGCTKPMSGGISRAGSVLRGGHVVVVGPLIKGAGRQDELKAETLAEAVAQWKGVLALSESDLQMEAGLLASVKRLAQRTADTPQRLGPFSVVSLAPDSASVLSALRSAGSQKLVIALRGGEREARSLAEQVPGIPLILFESESPTLKPIQIGRTTLASPGGEGKTVLRLTPMSIGFRVEAIDLGPKIADDPRSKSLYLSYLQRVSSEKLLDRLPRSSSPAFAGNQKCGSCHGAAMKAWKASGHSKALATLSATKHDRDPDCASCHVVGLTSKGGFQSLAKTPQLANVGCESCHGPGAAHASKPTVVKMPPAGEKSCRSCHVPAHSPSFDFAKYWSKIKH